MFIYRRNKHFVGKGYAIINRVDEFGYVHITHFKRLFHLKEFVDGTERKKHINILVYSIRCFLKKYSLHSKHNNYSLKKNKF